MTLAWLNESDRLKPVLVQVRNDIQAAATLADAYAVFKQIEDAA